MLYDYGAELRQEDGFIHTSVSNVSRRWIFRSRETSDFGYYLILIDLKSGDFGLQLLTHVGKPEAGRFRTPKAGVT
jgi:hypothetical protein